MRNSLLPEQRVKAIGDEIAGFLLSDVIPDKAEFSCNKKATDLCCAGYRMYGLMSRWPISLV